MTEGEQNVIVSEEAAKVLGAYIGVAALMGLAFMSFGNKELQEKLVAIHGACLARGVDIRK